MDIADLTDQFSIHKKTPVILIGGGSVKNKLIELSDSATISKYINISFPSMTAWPIFAEEIGQRCYDENLNPIDPDSKCLIQEYNLSKN